MRLLREWPHFVGDGINLWLRNAHLKAHSRTLLLKCGLSKRSKKIPPLFMGVKIHPQELCGGHRICLKPNSVAELQYIPPVASTLQSTFYKRQEGTR